MCNLSNNIKVFQRLLNSPTRDGSIFKLTEKPTFAINNHCSFEKILVENTEERRVAGAFSNDWCEGRVLIRVAGFNAKE